MWYVEKFNGIMLYKNKILGSQDRLKWKLSWLARLTYKSFSVNIVILIIKIVQFVIRVFTVVVK